MAAGGDAMRWDDPHAVPGDPYERRDTLDEEYSRVTNPEKYAIVEVRFDAWVEALTAPNADAGGAPLAAVTEHDDMTATGMPTRWGGDDVQPASRVRTLTPRVDARELRLAAWMQDPEALFFEIAVGDPARVVLGTPHCGCDACDSGADGLLEEIDRWILSIVDGSFEIITKDHLRSARTSFGGDSSLEKAQTATGTRTLIGCSWWPGKRSRPLIPPF